MCRNAFEFTAFEHKSFVLNTHSIVGDFTSHYSNRGYDDQGNVIIVMLTAIVLILK